MENKNKSSVAKRFNLIVRRPFCYKWS